MAAHCRSRIHILICSPHSPRDTRLTSKERRAQDSKTLILPKAVAPKQQQDRTR